MGKSTIVNRLVGFDLLATRDVRVSDSRGRHTSTSRQLVRLPEHGILIDTPGMRELQLWETGDAAASTFADISTLGEQCRFRDCQHRGEPGCAVAAAVQAGELSAHRLESFHKLQSEQAHQHRQQDQRAQLEQKRRTKTIMKSVRKHLKDKGYVDARRARGPGRPGSGREGRRQHAVRASIAGTVPPLAGILDRRCPPRRKVRT